jgi:hypothetical protein
MDLRTTNPPKPVTPPRAPGKPVEDPPRIDAQDDAQQLISIPLRPSSQIASAMYDPKLLELIVEFVSGAVYKYSNVDQVAIAGWSSADSPGKYFIANIKEAGFAYERLQ